jgi:two-component system nitrogen regulation response regulator NtrX
MSIPHFDAKAIVLMQKYNWPGNIRQLKNVVEWVMIMNGPAGETGYTVASLPPEISGFSRQGMAVESTQDKLPILQDDLMGLGLRDARESFEKLYLNAQIDKFDGNVSKTAQFIGMERSALHRKLKSLNIVIGEREPGSENSKAEDESAVLKKVKRA